MIPKRLDRRTISGALTAVVLLALPGTSNALYSLTLLQPLAGDSVVEVFAVNSAGQAVGYSRAATTSDRAVIWNNGSPQALPELPGAASSRAFGINASGHAVGRSLVAGLPQATLWNGSSASALGSEGNSTALGINSSGQVVGSIYNASLNRNEGVVWTNGVAERLPLISGFSTATPVSISDGGRVVGGVNTFAPSVPAVWTNGSGTFLPCGGFSCLATAVNDAGVIIGERVPFRNGPTQAVRWINGVQDDLPMSTARGLNALGHIVGSGATPQDSRAAILYRDGERIVLNDVVQGLGGWRLLEATGINDRGQIIGAARLNGLDSAFLLTPLDTAVVPLPAAAWSMLLGIAMIGWTARRKRRV